MPRGKRKITKTANHRQKQRIREKYAKAKLKNDSDYFTEEDKANLRDDDLHDEVTVRTTPDSKMELHLQKRALTSKQKISKHH